VFGQRLPQGVDPEVKRLRIFVIRGGWADFLRDANGLLGQLPERCRTGVERLRVAYLRGDLIEHAEQRLAALAIGCRQRGDGLTRQYQVVVQALAGMRHLGLVEPFFAGIGEGDQVAGEIAAVHGRDIGWFQRAHVLGGVPVEEVAAVSLQPAHAVQRRLHSLECLQRAGPAEITCGDGRKQIQAHVGGRGSARDDRLGLFLEIVRRQHVVGGGDECFEEAPGAPCNQAQLLGIRFSQFLTGSDAR